MVITHIPLLQLQRELHDVPRGIERFNAYLRLMTTDTKDDLRYPPMAIMNPMGREHVIERLDALLAMDAESIAAEALRDAELRLPDAVGTYQHGFGVADDVMGGWTNRYTSESSFWFELDSIIKRGWMATILWAGETPSGRQIYQSVLMTVYRTVYAAMQGLPGTLRQMMAQEGEAAAFAGIEPLTDDEEIAYNREILKPLLDSTEFPVRFAGMYGDVAARALGYPPLGLSDRAGFAVALAEALSRNERIP